MNVSARSYDIIDSHIEATVVESHSVPSAGRLKCSAEKPTNDEAGIQGEHSLYSIYVMMVVVDVLCQIIVITASSYILY